MVVGVPPGSKDSGGESPVEQGILCWFDSMTHIQVLFEELNFPQSDDLPKIGIRNAHGLSTWGMGQVGHFSSPRMAWRYRRYRSFGRGPPKKFLNAWLFWLEQARTREWIVGRMALGHFV